MRISLAVVCFVVGAAALPAADDTLQFQNFVRGYAAKMRANDRTPTSADEWLQRKAEIRRGLEEAWDFPKEKCPLEPKQLGEEQRDGYRFEKLIFQTMPGVWMTAHAYIPDGKGPFPAILQVHGHWKGAKQDPVPQARCIGAAKQGFFVLAVDAFGQLANLTSIDFVRINTGVHVVRPIFGESSTEVASITVVADAGWRAEVLATGAAIGGVDEAIGYLEGQGVDGVVVDRFGAVRATMALPEAAAAR